MRHRLSRTVTLGLIFAAVAVSEPIKTKHSSLELTAPLFLESDGISSTISLINIVNRPLSATLTAFTPDGRQIGQTAIHVEPHSAVTRKLADLLKGWASTATSGSLELTPDGPDIGIAGMLTIDGSAAGTAIHLEEDFTASNSGVTSLRSAATGLAGPPTVALWNRAHTAESVSLHCISEQGGQTARAISVPAGQMVLAGACDGAVAATPQAALSAAPPSSAIPQSAGIEVGLPDAPLSVYGFALRAAASNPEAAALHFQNASQMRSADSVFTGVPVGRSALLPGPMFQPELALANFGAEPAHVSVAFATAPRGEPSARAIKDVTVPAGAIRKVTLPALGGDSLHRNSFVLRSEAPAGTLITSLLSSAQDGSPGLMTMPGKDRIRDTNGGAGRWSLANGDTSTLVIFNPTESTQTMTVHVGALGVLWAKNYSLAPMETKSIAVSDLIANAEPDMHGTRIPSDSTEGQIAWFTPNHGEGLGRLLVTHSGSTHAVSPEYSFYSVLCGVTLDPFDISFDFGDYGDLGPMEPQYCTSISPVACTGTAEGPGGGSYQWTSGNSSVAPISGSSTYSSASFYGAYPGEASASCQVSTIYCVYECPPASATVTLQAQLHPSLTATTIPVANGTATLSGWVAIGTAPSGFNDPIDVTYQASSTIVPNSMNASFNPNTGNPAQPIVTTAPGTTATFSWILSTSSQNNQSGYANLVLGVNASDPRSSAVLFDFNHTNQYSQQVTVQ